MILATFKCSLWKICALTDRWRDGGGRRDGGGGEAAEAAEEVEEEGGDMERMQRRVDEMRREMEDMREELRELRDLEEIRRRQNLRLERANCELKAELGRR